MIHMKQILHLAPLKIISLWQSGSDSRWFLSKEKMEKKLNGTRDPSPIHAKCHKNFHLLTAVPYVEVRKIARFFHR